VFGTARPTRAPRPTRFGVRDPAWRLSAGANRICTNALVIDDQGDGATVRSKGIGIMADGTSGTVVYEDLVRRTSAGWRIARRTVIPRRRPLHP